MRTQVTDRAAARYVLIQAPDLWRAVMGHNPFLQVYRPEVINLAQGTLVDQIADHAHCRYKAVVESHHMLDIRFLDRIQHLL